MHIKAVPVGLIAVNTKGNEAENLGLGRIKEYLSSLPNCEVELQYLYDYSPHQENLNRLMKGFSILALDLYHDTAEYIYELIREIKGILPNIKIIVGSKFATVAYKEILDECREIDYVVLGDGEGPIEYLVSLENTKIEYTAQVNIARIGDIEDKKPLYRKVELYPEPSRHKPLLDSQQRAYLYTSNGCKGRCTFCCSNVKRTWSFRDGDNIYSEIIKLNRDYEVNNFFFTDDNFGEYFPHAKIDRIIALCNLLIENENRFAFGAQVRADSYIFENLNLLNLMSKAGFHMLFLGIETMSPHDLMVYNKNVNLGKTIEAIEKLKKSEIDPSFFGFIFYGPYSTLESLNENAKFLISQSNWDIGKYISKLSIFYKSNIYQTMKKDGLLTEKYNYKSDYDYVFTDSAVHEVDKIIKSIKTSDFVGAIMDFYNLNMYFSAMNKIHPGLLEDNFLKFMTYRNSIAQESAEFFKILYLDNDFSAVEKLKNSFKSTIINFIENSKIEKFRMIKKLAKEKFKDEI